MFIEGLGILGRKCFCLWFSLVSNDESVTFSPGETLES